MEFSHLEGVGDEEGEVGVQGILPVEINTAGKQSEIRVHLIWQVIHITDATAILRDVQVRKPREVSPTLIIILHGVQDSFSSSHTLCNTGM